MKSVLNFSSAQKGLVKYRHNGVSPGLECVHLIKLKLGTHWTRDFPFPSVPCPKTQKPGIFPPKDITENGLRCSYLSYKHLASSLLQIQPPRTMENHWLKNNSLWRTRICVQAVESQYLWKGGGGGGVGHSHKAKLEKQCHCSKWVVNSKWPLEVRGLAPHLHSAYFCWTDESGHKYLAGYRRDWHCKRYIQMPWTYPLHPGQMFRCFSFSRVPSLPSHPCVTPFPKGSNPCWSHMGNPCLFQNIILNIIGAHQHIR